MTTTNTAPRRTGSRKALPEDALRSCVACGTLRGTRTKGWGQVVRSGVLVGYTCPDCPLDSEPIHCETSGRFLAELWVSSRSGEAKARTKFKRRFDHLDDARDWVAEVRESAQAASDYANTRGLTVRQLTDRWLTKREAEIGAPGGIRTNTLNGYRSALSSLLGLIGDRPAREVTADDIEAALRTLASVGGKWGRPLSHRSLSYALGALRMAYAYGKRSRWVRSNPADEARAPRKGTTAARGQTAGAAVEADAAPAAVRRWTRDQMLTFRKHMDGLPLDAEPWLRVGMRLVLCGLRRSEVLGLDWETVDRTTGAVGVAASRTKTGRGNATELNGVKTDNSERIVQADLVHPGTAKALRTLWLAQGRPARGLVITDSAGEPVQPDAFSRRFRALCAAAGVPPLTRVHNTRHSLATMLQDAGVPDNQAAALLGHDVATYRKFYLVTDDEGAASAAAAAGKLFAAV